ncbi:MAG TPA: acetate kinase [Candidatus Marinimicrobia bacterium]|nr:acetate kinase [Candidatus Neomarinimicrobiota bacterium]
MRVLTINSGSSSVKYQFIDTDTKQSLCRGLVERIGISGTNLSHTRHDGVKTIISDNIVNHETAIEQILKILVHPQFGVISDLKEIDAVGHRLVHAGDKFKQSVLIDEEVREKLYECIEYAPLHNPPNIKGVEASLEKLPGISNVGVFDTTFHVNMPDYAYTYGIPYSYYKNHGIRRYGFHGSSHYYVAHRAAEILGKDIKSLKIITCHLGNGSSITAVKGGVSVDTSMGFTPLEGLLMGTRCGDIDPGVIFTIASRENFDIGQANAFFNKQCGIQGISGLTNDMREIEAEAENGNYQAQLALKVFSYRLKKYIASYMGVMNGADVIVFTGGIGENSDVVRSMSLSEMDNLGIKLDAKINKATRSSETIISADSSPVKVMVIPTNEELVIAMETQRVIMGENQD